MDILPINFIAWESVEGFDRERDCAVSGNCYMCRELRTGKIFDVKGMKLGPFW